MGIIAWIILGLLAGVIAKALLPGDDPGGFIITTLIGIVGAILGGFLAAALFGADLILAGHIHQSTVAERREFELSTPEGEHAVVVSIAPGFGQPRPNRRGEARGLHVYEIEAEALRILTYIWREDGWGLTAVRTFPRGRKPLRFSAS